MKTHGYMILVYDPDIGYYKPINEKEYLSYNPWFFSQTAVNQAIASLESNPRFTQHKFRLCAVKGLS